MSQQRSRQQYGSCHKYEEPKWMTNEPSTIGLKPSSIEKSVKKPLELVSHGKTNLCLIIDFSPLEQIQLFPNLLGVGLFR